MSFTSLLNEIQTILEQSRYDVLVQKWATAKKKGQKPKIELDVLTDLMQADPTTKGDFEGDRDTRDVTKVGAYSQWLIKQWMGLQQKADEVYAYGSPDWGVKLEQLQAQFMEDLYKVTDDLLKFDYLKKTGRYKGEKDINQIKSIDDLYDQVKDYNISKDELTTTKAERAEMEVHPGAKMGHDGSRWQVIEIEDNPMGKEAACYYGGQNRETRWCTSSPGLTYYDRYIKDGPLYVVMDKTDTEVATPQGRDSESHKQTGLPKKRYQFHFPSSQFMDIDDRQINLEDFLNTEGKELKDYFRHEFAKSLTSFDGTGDKVSVSYPNDKVSRFISLYGFDEFFEKLPSTLQRFDFEMKKQGYGASSKTTIPSINLGEKLKSFPNLKIFHVEGLLNELPDSMGQLKELQFISAPHNPNLEYISDELANLPNLQVLNIRNSPKAKIGPILQQKADDGEIVIVQ